MKKLLILSIAVFLLTSAGFSKQPVLKKAVIEPAAAAPGDSIKITAEFSGKQKDIRGITIIAREYPYDGPTIHLQPCKDKKENVWFFKGAVPYDAPNEIFHLDITAIDKKGKEIISKGFENQSTGHAGTIKFEVKY